MDTENSFLSSKVLLTTGIVISTLLLCVVATELPIGFSRPASPMQQAIHQRQQGRFTEFYPGSQPAAAPKPALAASGPANAPKFAASSTASTVASQSTIEGSAEQSYTPEAKSSFESTFHSDSGLKVPVNVTVNHTDLAPQLASLNARLDELTRQLNERSSADSERVFEYRIEESVAKKATSATSTTPAAPAQSQIAKEVTVVTTSGSSIDSLKSVPGVTTIPVAQANQPASATFVPAAPMASATPAPQVIVVTQPVYPWAMPPGTVPPGSGYTPPPAMTSVPAESVPVTAQTAPSKTKDSLADSSDRNVRDSRDSNGVTNVFPLNLQMSLNIAPPANTEPAPKVAADSPQMPRQESASTTRKTAMTSQPPVALPTLAIEQRPEPSAIRTPAPVPAPAPVAVASTGAAKAPAVAKQPEPSEHEDVAELFMPFEPAEEPKPEVAVKSSSTTKSSSTAEANSTTEVPVTKAESRPVAAEDSFDFETASASAANEEPAPVLEPIRDSATVETASASKASLPELFMPEPMNDDTNKVQPVAAEKEVPTPQPDPMFLTPSANSTLPPQALRAIPIPEEPSHAPAAERTASTLTIPPDLKTPPVVSTPAAPSTETVVIWESPMPPSPAPSSKGKTTRSRFSAMRDAISEAGEEVRERFDNIPRPSFEAPNWMEKLRGESDSSDSASPPTAPVVPPAQRNSVGPRRFHDAQNAAGKPGQAMLQGSRANVARRDSGRTQQAQPTNAQVARSAVSSPPRLSGPVRQNSPAGVPATAQNQPRRVMGHNGQTVSRSALSVPNLSVPRFDTPDWIEDPPVTLPSPPISQTAHRISSALRFAGQSKSVR